MAAIQAMGWRKKEKRWVKKYRGRFYYVSAKELGHEPTKEASRQVANEWWDKKTERN